MEWKEQYAIIKKIIAERLAKTGQKFTLANAAALLGVKVPKIQAWGKGQLPSSEDLTTLTRVLDLSADWILLGNGTPTRDPGSGVFIKEYVDICDTLNELVHILPEGLSEVAETGGVTVTELNEILRNHALPSCLTVARWVHKYHINANFLIAQIGQPFLTDFEYAEKGPADRLRESRGDFRQEEPSSEESFTDPVVERAERIAALMSRHGADDAEVREAILASMRAQVPGVGESTPLHTVAEPDEDYDTK